MKRYRDEGKFSNAPDTKQQSDLARGKAEDIPVLMLMRQNGKEADGWRDLPFWWPVIVTESCCDVDLRGSRASRDLIWFSLTTLLRPARR